MASFILPKINMEEKLLEKTFLLKEISLRKILIILWSQLNIFISFAKLNFQNKTEEEIKNKLSKLQLPFVITQQMKCLIAPIGLEIRKWICFHSELFNVSHGILDAQIFEHLYWTLFGTIDYRKTAKNLIYLEDLDIVERYKLACTYCLDDAIPVLWERLPENCKRYFYIEIGSNIRNPRLEFCWPYIIRREEAKLQDMLDKVIEHPTSFNLYAFQYLAKKGNKSATDYFLKRLPHVEREDSLLRTAEAVLCQRIVEVNLSMYRCPNERLSETFFHLLSLLTSEKQMEIFNKHTDFILLFLLDFPWRCIFLDVAALIWPFVTEEDYHHVLQEISVRMRVGYDFQKLFQDFFLLGPNDFKKYFVSQECHSTYCLLQLFNSNLSEIKAAELMKVIFRNIDSADRKRLVTSDFFFSYFYTMLFCDEWHLVEPYLQESTLSKKDKKDVLEAFLLFLETNEEKKANLTGSSWERFLQFFCESEGEVPSTKADLKKSVKRPKMQ